MQFDQLSRKREFHFKNKNNNFVRIHTHLVNQQYNIWRANDGKTFRDTTQLLINNLSQMNIDQVVKFVIVDAKKLGGAIGSYDHEKKIIYISNACHNEDEVEKRLSSHYFAARSFKGIILHEYGHFLHWRSVQKFYQLNKNRYNNLNQAKAAFDSKLERYLKNQYPEYMVKNFSFYAKFAFDKSNQVNEVVAEFIVLSKIKNDPFVQKIIEEMLNYGNNE